MRAVGRFLVSGIGLTLILGIVLSLALWFFGAFLGIGEARPFDSVLGRLVGLAVLWILLLIVILIILLRRGRKDDAMAEEIVTSAEPAAQEDEVVTAELGEMRDKLKSAMQALRKSKRGKRHLYELPWYIIIGPPGAGKTTAIVNSDLQFPLADEVGAGAVGGVGGTRNCDWWFTDQAVLVDTAGRYTTQESDAQADNAAWLGFLNILKKHRPRQPINGALVAISLSDLSMTDAQTQKSHAAAIRRRLSELRERLGVRFPVYVLFTKADLIAGFAEFYEPLGREERAQVWGFTLPLAQGKSDASPIAAFDGEYQALLDRLNEQSLERMQAETDPARRSLIASFPSQVASVRTVARDFLTELFQDNTYQHRQMLRGVYFTSGTQEGTPIDRLMMGMARTFGIGRQAIGTGQGTGRSYFLTRLFDAVIFRESGLVSADDRAERRYRWTKRGTIAAAILLAAAAGGLWTRSYLGNMALAEDIEDRVEAYQTAAAQIPPSPVGDSDLPAVVPALNVLRDLPGNPTAGDPPRPGHLGWGLYQGGILGTQAAQTYRAALNQHFLPRLLLRLEEQMQGNINNADLLFEALKIYLMLGLSGPMNTDLIKEWMEVDWSLAYPGPNREALRDDLAVHLNALLGQPMEKVELNGELVDQVRDVLTRMPMAQRVYSGILGSPAAQDLSDWRLTDVGGPALNRAMVRSSGKKLNEGIEGIFTYEGFNTVFLNEALGVAKRIQRDAWVLGPEALADQSDTALLAVSRDVLNLYYNDFIQRYDQLLGDLDIVPLESLSHAVEVTNVLSGPTSPIVNVLEAVAAETALTEDRSETAGAEAGGAAVGASEIRRRLSPNAAIFLEAMAAASGQSAEAPGAYVENRFDWLHTLVAQDDGQPSQLDGLMDQLQEVYQELNKLNFAGGSNATLTGDIPALQRFKQAAARIDGPLERWSNQISGGSSGIATEGTRSGMNARWQSDVLPFCQQATADAYPFNRRARPDISIADFTRLFGPDGLIDGFFKQNMASFVDTRSRPWQWKKVNDIDLGISQQVLEQFQYAAEIRDAFFQGGGPRIQFQVTPEALDPKAQAILLEIDGTKVEYAHTDGQPTPVGVTWPGPVGLGRVTFSPRIPNAESSLTRDGPWGWFRLLDAAEVRRTNVPDRKRMIFRVGGRIAIFQLQSSSVLNPFALPALETFSCPTSF
ncbi:type VI secretion system membrane subunit TssM [Rhodobacteraceae bacterium CCMM004]|nr:type VI secretion system membrane subunit TssM [Rhodobacteraceae bacterium CCMM004]